MSYDLYFSGRKLSPDEFTAYFSARPNYRVNDARSQAWYQNEDTGIYFSFDLNQEEKLDPEAPDYDVSFNLNYVRPHIFGLEAEPEVRAFIEAFSFSINDPQTHGMAQGPYSSAGFLAGWNAGNEFGYSAILNDSKTDAAKLASYPSESIEQLWRWNLNRNNVQEQLGPDLFVPKILFLQVGGKVLSCVVWGDAIPSLLPRVDRIVVPRKELAPRVLFQKKEDMCLVNFSEVADVFGGYLIHDYNLPAILLPHPKSPAPVINFVRGLRPSEVKLASISVDKVLDWELIERYRPSI